MAPKTRRASEASDVVPSGKKSRSTPARRRPKPSPALVGDSQDSGRATAVTDGRKRRRSKSPQSAQHTCSRSVSLSASPLCEEYGKKLEPKHLAFNTMGHEELKSLGNKGPWELLIHPYVVQFGKDVNGVSRQPPRVPLCRLMTMEAVRSLQEDDVNMLKERFYETGYVTTMPEFFLVCKNSAGESQIVADFVDKWDQAWKDINDAFEKECKAVEEFRILKDQMF